MELTKIMERDEQGLPAIHPGEFLAETLQALRFRLAPHTRAAVLRLAGE
jgi:hypothetical protein